MDPWTIIGWFIVGALIVQTIKVLWHMLCDW